MLCYAWCQLAVLLLIPCNTTHSNTFSTIEVACVDDQSVTTDTGLCTYTHTGTGWDADSQGNGDIASVEYALTGATTGTGTTLNGVVFQVGVTTVVWTATDTNGNTASCSFTVTVADNEPPLFSPPSNITIYVNTQCEYDASPQFTGNVGNLSDNCTPPGEISVSYTDSIAEGACPGTFVITRTWIVTDASGNEATHDQVITVADNTLPSLNLPPGIQIECDEDPDDLQITGQASGSNACGGEVHISYSDETVPGTCPQSYDILRTWSAVDCSGNTRSGVQRIRVRDTTPPAVESLPTLYVPCPQDVPEPDSTMVQAQDNCGPVTVRFHREIAYGLDQQPGYCPDSLDHVYRATDPCGNYTEVTHRIVIEDDCGCSPCDGYDSFYTVDLLGQPDGVATLESITRHDLCCDATRPSRCASFNIRIDENAVGVIISVGGATPSPMDWNIDCAEAPLVDGNIICIPGGDFYLFTYCKPGGDSNDFTFQSVPGVIVDSEIFTRVSCNTEILVEGDVTNPVWNSIYPGEPGAYNHYLSCQECHDPVFIPDENAPPEIHYEVCGELAQGPCTDETGIACSTVRIYVLGEIEVGFNVDPGAYCEDNIPLIETTISPHGANYTYEWFDGPDATGNLLGTEPNFLPPGQGEYSLRIRDIDEGVLCSELIYNFVVEPDDTPPVVVPPEDLVLECNDPANPQLIADWRQQASATDDNTAEQDLVTWDDYAGMDQYCDKELVVTFFAEDECGNVGEATARIIIIDTLPPELVETAPDIVVATGPDLCEVNLEDIALTPPVFRDQCDGTNVTLTNNAAGTFSPGETTIVWTATDACGNTATTTQSITVVDDQPPDLVCPEPIVREADWGEDYASDVEVAPPEYSDNCEVVTLQWNMTGATTASSPTGGIHVLAVHTFNVGVTTVEYTAIDPSGNTTSCTFTVTITSVPVIGCPDDIIASTDDGLCTASLDPGSPTLLSGAEPVSWEWEMTGATVASGTGRPISPVPFTFNTGITYITWHATNDSGTDSCMQTIAVTDDEPPTFVTPQPPAYCVWDIMEATYNWMPEPDADIEPERPDWYILPGGSTDLDITGIWDNCCDPGEITIHWEIVYDPVSGMPPLSGTGQPSAFDPEGSGIPQDIILWGTADNVELTHTITYRAEDCNGNISEGEQVEITIIPRPHMLKQSDD